MFSYTRVNTAQAAAGINHQINFQGKLVNLNGTNVADGSYSVVFSIYNVASAGTNLWTETQSVTVTNGIFQVNLGSVTTLPASVDFNTDNIYLGIKVGADAEMTPRVQFTSVPQAFNSEKLGGLTSAGFIQNTTVQQASSNFNISGTGVATSLQASTFDTNSAVTLNIGTANASALIISKTGVLSTVAGSLTVTQATTLTGGLINPGATLNTALALGNFATGGSIGTAAATVDTHSTFTIAQTTAGQTLTLPSPTTTTAGREIRVSNIGTTSFAIGSAVINANVTASYFWNGTAWTATGIDTGVTISGALDGGGTTSATGAYITGNTIYLQAANGANPGLINGAAQTFNGVKTFASQAVLSAGVQVASQQTINFVGGSTAQRPASPTTGTLYFDTTTNTMLQYNGSKWVSDHNTSTKIVAASNSSQAIKDSADYIATGTGDQATINTALTAAAGGSVYLAEGTYSETASINIPNNTTLFGAGAGTLITIPIAQNGTYNIITNNDNPGTHVTIHDLQIDGNKANQTSGAMYGINFSAMGGGSGGTARDGAKITNTIIRMAYNGVGINLTSSNNNTFTGNTIYGNSNNGILLNGSSYNTVTGNVFQGNGNVGIFLNSSSNSNTVTGNTSQGNNQGIYVLSSSNNTITGNTSQGNSNYGIAFDTASSNIANGNNVQGNGSYGVYLTGSSNNTVTGNTAQGNGNGILLSSSSNNTVTGNTAQGNTTYGINVTTSSNNTISGNTVVGSGTIGIVMGTGSNNIIANNKIHDSGGANANNGLFLFVSSTANTITGNDITDTSCTTTCYAINISDSGSTSNYLSNNRHTGTTANPSTINDAAPNTIYANQLDGSGNLINRNQGGLTVGTTTASKTLTLQGSLSASQLPTPAAPTLAVAGTAGTTTISYAISALDGSGETLPSTATTTTTANATLSGANYVTINWTQVGGAVQYKVFRTTTNGTSPTTTGLIATVNANVFTVNDTGLAAAGAVAAANTTGNATVAGLIQGGGLNITGTSSLVGALTLGTASSATGQLKLANATSAFTATIQSAAYAQNSVITLPAAGAADTFCLLTLANCGSGGGATSVGAIDTGTYSANGGSIAAGVLYLQAATTGKVGLVTTAAQNFDGNKTFNNGLTVAANQGLTLASGGGSISQTFLGGTSGNAISQTVTNNNATATTATVNAHNIALVGGANANVGANTINGLNLANVMPVTNNNFIGIAFGTGFNNLITYAGAAVINGTGILQSASVSGTYGGITGTGALASGSIASGFGTINIANNITTSTTVQGATLNATTGFTLNGTNINTAGTLSNVAYLTQANVFTAANTFNAALTVQETTAPAFATGFGKLYVNSTDHALHFVNNTGIDTTLGTITRAKKVVLTAEYAGSVLDATADAACSAANSGSMTSGLDATNRQNYYQWSSTGTSQCYDVVVQVPIPSDYQSMNGAPTLATYNSLATDATSIKIVAYDTAGAVETGYTASYVGVSSSTTLATQTLPTLTGTYTAGGYMTFKIRTTSSASTNVRLGNLTLNYTSAY